MAQQGDGKVLIGGAFAHVNGVAEPGIARLNTDGSTDPSFAPPALTVFSNVTSPAHIYTVAVQPDGRVIIGGQIAYKNKTRNLVRLLANGGFDASFDVISEDGDFVEALALQPDGKVIAAGVLEIIDSTPVQNIVRVDTRGNLDTYANADKEVDGIWLDQTGNILLQGEFANVNGLSRPGLVRLTRDLLNGRIQSIPSEQVFRKRMSRSVLVQSDNTYVLGGFFSSVDGVTRNNVAPVGPGGRLDDTLNLSANKEVDAIAVESNGNLLVGGVFDTMGSVTRNNLARVQTDGTLSSGYDPDVTGSVLDIVIKADGSALIAGDFTQVGGANRAYLAHLSSAGNLDTAFTPVFDNYVSGLVTQANGQILVSGGFTTVNGASHVTFARLNADGGPDTAFNVVPDNVVTSMAVQADGRILIGGYFTTIGSTPVPHLARLNADGTIDASFLGTTDGVVYAIVLEPAGTLLISAGSSTVDGQTCTTVARLNADGSFNRCFAAQPDSAPNGITPLSDGKIVIKGPFDTIDEIPYSHLARLNADGSLDTSFPSFGANGNVMAIAPARDGKLAVGGRFTQMGGQTRAHLARISFPDPAQQSLTVSNQGLVTWLRSGTTAAPEIPPTLLYSTDFSTYAPLGSMTYSAGSWQFAGLQPVIDHRYSLRVQAAGSTGEYGGPGASSIQYNVDMFWDDHIFMDGMGD